MSKYNFVYWPSTECDIVLSSLRSYAIDNASSQDAEQIRFDACLLTKTLQAAQKAEEGLLHDVFRVRVIDETRTRVRQQASLIPRHKLRPARRVTAANLREGSSLAVTFGGYAR